MRLEASLSGKLTEYLEKELKNAVSFEEILKREGLTYGRL